MTAVTEKGIAIAELIVYISISLATLLVVLRHGFHRQLGWIYLFIFSGVRIAGAVMEILSETHPDNTTDLEWAIILQSVGLSPLLLSSLGLLKRVYVKSSDVLVALTPSKNSHLIVLMRFATTCHQPKAPGPLWCCRN